MSKKKLRPCDCKDMATAMKLEEQGISHNEDRIMLKPNVVEMTIGLTTVRVPMHLFKMFAEWYMTEQEIK
jgi:hypothetical protein